MVRPKAIKDWCYRIDQWSPLATIYFLLYKKSWLPAAFIILSLWLYWPAEKRKEKDKIRPVNNHLKERIRRQDSFSCKLLRWAQFLSPLSLILCGPSVKLREWMTFSYFLFHFVISPPSYFLVHSRWRWSQRKRKGKRNGLVFVRFADSFFIFCHLTGQAISSFSFILCECAWPGMTEN